MLTELCAEIRNYFLRDYREDIHAGTFTISGGEIEPLSFLQPGQYFRIVGSVFNDGVWVYGENNSENVLLDETFRGEIWAMAVPPAVIVLSKEIDEWVSKNAEILASPYQSESFGGYSYSKGSGGSSDAAGYGASYSWKTHFASKLIPYRRISVL